MIRRAAAALLISVASCTEPNATLSAERFTGSWRSVSPSYEHLRLTVSRTAYDPAVLGARITFSGTAWEGPARIEADSLIMDVTTSAVSGSALIAHPGENGALSVRIRSNTMDPLSLTFVRE